MTRRKSIYDIKDEIRAMGEPQTHEEWMIQHDMYIEKVEAWRRERRREEIKVCAGCVFFIFLIVIGIAAQIIRVLELMS